MSIFTRTAIAGVLGFAIFAVLDYWRITVKNRYIRAINLRIKTRLIHKIIEQNAAEIDTDGALSLFTNDLKLLENNGIRNEVQLIQQALIVVFAVIGGFYFDLPSTLVFAVGGVVPLLVSNKLHPRIVAKSKRWSQNNAAFTGSIKDTLLGIESIRNYFAQQISERRLVKGAADVEDTQNEMNATQGHVSVLTKLAVHWMRNSRRRFTRRFLLREKRSSRWHTILIRRRKHSLINSLLCTRD
jgi:ABC-type multidrug transport system fused ATPase/permease subunit